MEIASLTSDKVRVLHVSDIHLFHPRNDTFSVIAKLKRYIFRTDIDILVFGGDIYDSLVSLAHEAVWAAFIFAAETLRHCKKHNIEMYVLRGTPDHDWGQNQIFSTMARVTGTQDILHLKDDIEIVYNERFGLHLLFIPDEARPTSAAIFKVVMEEMTRLGITQVDICVMHGTFDYQLPFAPEKLHSSEAFHKIVKYFTSVGHIHQNSRNGNIIAQGSFDRGIHGDESAKGFHITTIDKSTQSWTTQFIENKEALIFKTIDLSGLGLDVALKKLEKLAKELPDHSHLRYLAESSSPVFQALTVIQKTFPQFRWTKKATDTKTRKNSILELSKTFSAVQLTKDNLGELLAARIKTKHALEFSDEVIKQTIERHL